MDQSCHFPLRLVRVYKEFEKFAVRLIVDCRRTNSRLFRSPYVPLSTPAGILSCLRVLVRARRRSRPWEEPRLLIGKRDVSCCYYRCRLPAAWWGHLALPSILAKDLWDVVKGHAIEVRTRTGEVVTRPVRPADTIHPTLRVVPMGLGHAVYLVQRFHEYLVEKMTGLQKFVFAREWGCAPQSLRLMG